jgi:hypothetical protein
MPGNNDTQVVHIPEFLRNLMTFKRIAKVRFTAAYRDMNNRIKYGPTAPLFAERLFIRPSSCERAFSGWYDNAYSGEVIEFDWPFSRVTNIIEVPKIKFCFDHWVNGVPWENTGAFEFMEHLIKKWGRRVDGCKSIDDIVGRYQKLDEIFVQVKKEGRLKTRKEINPYNFRERGGIFFHIGPEGELFFSLRGAHRLAMALILEIKIVPIQMGRVHTSALSFLPEMRMEKE